MGTPIDRAAGTPPLVAVVLATGNRDKVREFKPMLEGISPQLRLYSLDDLALSPEIEETEPTLEGNARLKAEALYSLAEPMFEWLIVLADDTGLEVNALGGAPGVRSARFAPAPDGSSPSYEDNVSHLLKSIDGAPVRTARFRTVIALKGRMPSRDGGCFMVDETVEGRIDGTITGERFGSGGFGYDPVFRPDGAGKTFAEMSLEEKNAISHRALAVRSATARIRDLMAHAGIPSTETGNHP
jgi:XTP/dITP diphosphohydrolase